ncbi:MAG: RNA-binding protein [Gammaproteobacteria bacterium]|nr:MAG: RNA-binding protein [Gammaproteobacteria bacterium]
MTHNKQPSRDTRGQKAETAEQRLDKWLWAARFFKTRSLAAAAITSGKVQIDCQRTKPSKSIHPGTRLTIRRGSMQWDVVVRALAAQRRAAPEAAQLYEESATSIARRAEETERRKNENMQRTRGIGRPTKRARREWQRIHRG